MFFLSHRYMLKKSVCTTDGGARNLSFKLYAFFILYVCYVLLLLQSRYFGCLLVFFCSFKKTIWLPENLKFVELIPNETNKSFNIIDYTA